MKKLAICFLCSIFFHRQAESQDSLKLKAADTLHKMYRARINLFKGKPETLYLMAIKDSSMYLRESKMPSGSVNHNPMHKLDTSIRIYDFSSIESVVISNQKLKSWIIGGGAIAGLVVGAIIGRNSGSKGGYYSAFNTLLGGIVGSGLGALTGLAISGAFEKKYLINGEWKSFEDMKTKLKY